MSIRIMSAVFDSKALGPTERLVMLALADHADDEGKCYPAMKRLCERTGLSERAVQNNIGKLVNGGYLAITLGGGRGHANLYQITANPAADAPNKTPQQMHPKPINPAPRALNPAPRALNPAADAPEPSVTIKEPSVSKTREASDALEAWASPAAVTSFLAYRRKHKAGALSVTGAKRLATHLNTIFQRGGDCDDALAMAEEKGWASVEPDWYFKAKGNGYGNGAARQITDSPKRADPALEQIVRLAGLGQTPRDGRGGVGSSGEEDGSLWMGARPQ